MSQTWIQARIDLHEDPRVLAIAAATGLDEFGVVGRLIRVWGWFHQHTADGHAPGVTDVTVDRYAQRDGFASAMRAQKWLASGPGGDGLVMPDFDKHNSSSAKSRAQAAERQRRAREGRSAGPAAPPSRPERDAGHAERVTPVTPPAQHESRGERDQSVTRGEEKREEKRRQDSAVPRQPAKSLTEEKEEAEGGLREAVLAGWKGMSVSSALGTLGIYGPSLSAIDRCPGVTLEVVAEEWALVREAIAAMNGTGERIRKPAALLVWRLFARFGIDTGRARSRPLDEASMAVLERIERLRETRVHSAPATGGAQGVSHG